jgi:hypothetical protein
MSGLRDFWVRAALLLSLLIPVYFLFAALGTRFGMFDWTFGLLTMTQQWGERILLGGAVFALAGLLLACLVTPRRGRGLALIALLVPLGGIGYGLYLRHEAAELPAIHDVSTDLIDPPSFSDAVARARADVIGSNSLDLLGKRSAEGRAFIELQREGYPDIDSVATGLTQAQAFQVALALAREQKWTLGDVDAARGTIEATARSFWFGFIDDVVIRVRSDGSGARVDMRSVSRVGRVDLGANAARIRPFLRELRLRLEEAGG